MNRDLKYPRYPKRNLLLRVISIIAVSILFSCGVKDQNSKTSGKMFSGKFEILKKKVDMPLVGTWIMMHPRPFRKAFLSELVVLKTDIIKWYYFDMASDTAGVDFSQPSDSTIFTQVTINDSTMKLEYTLNEAKGLYSMSLSKYRFADATFDTVFFDDNKFARVSR